MTLSLNSAKLFLLLTALSLLVMLTWSLVNLFRGTSESVFTGVALGLSTASSIMVWLVYYHASCAF